MATHKRKSTKPWCIARINQYTGEYRSDRFFDNQEQAKEDFENNLGYHTSMGHKIMTSKEFYDFVEKQNKNKEKK